FKRSVKLAAKGTWKTAAGCNAWRASKSRAVSVTERVMAKLPAAPCQERQSVGPVTIRPRVGFKPMVPVQEAGIRMEPPPSLAAARGRSPAATAAPAPPDEPPG